jgi:hypothetical protein
MEVEGLFKRFHDAKQRVLAGQAEAKGDVDAIAASLAEQGEEVSELIGLELRQLERQLRQRATS